MVNTEDYVKRGGNFCPNCQEGQIEGDSVEIIDNEALQKMRCLDCGSSWHDVFRLVKYFDFEKGD